MKKSLILLLLFTTIQIIQAQEFRQAIGIRAGWSSGFEYRFYTNDLNSYRLLLSTRENGMQFHALKEFHRYDLFDFTDQLVFIFGAGAHVGYERWNELYYNYNSSYYRNRTAFIAGLDGLAGLEYTFYKAPVSIGFEVKPYFDLFGREVFDLDLFDFAFTAKYLF
ncbi:MAG: hypothetical protein R2757_05075 [Draconibacterium sp.]